MLKAPKDYAPRYAALKASTAKAARDEGGASNQALKVGAVVRIKRGKYEDWRGRIIGREGKRWTVLMGGWLLHLLPSALEVVGFDPFTPGSTPPPAPPTA